MYALTIENPCDTTILDDTQPPDQTYFLGDFKTYYLETKDSASQEYGDRTGLKFCGPRIYEVSVTPDSSFFSLDA